MEQTDFDKLFRALTGHSPFPWQSAYCKNLISDRFPSRASIPTGLGKTSIIAIWLIALYQKLREGDTSFPRRLFFVINRRTVVDAATDFAAQILANLEHPASPEVADMRHVFQKAGAFGEVASLGVSTLRGEFADNEEWRVDPARPSIAIGTIDKIGSKLLFAGYGDSAYTRPTAAALTGISSYVIYDEAHLEPAFSALLKSIGQFIAEEPTSGGERPFGSFHFTELTATPREGTGFELTQEDHQTEKVQQRIHPRKTLTLIPDNTNLTPTNLSQPLH